MRRGSSGPVGAGRAKEAIAGFDEAMKIDPNFALPHFHVCITYAKLGNWGKKVEMGEKGTRLAVYPGWAESMRVLMHAAKGEHAEAELLVKGMIELKKTTNISAAGSQNPLGCKRRNQNIHRARRFQRHRFLGVIFVYPADDICGWDGAFNIYIGRFFKILSVNNRDIKPAGLKKSRDIRRNRLGGNNIRAVAEKDLNCAFSCFFVGNHNRYKSTGHNFSRYLS
jgi:hypothetical protein